MLTHTAYNVYSDKLISTDDCTDVPYCTSAWNIPEAYKWFKYLAKVSQ